MSIVEIFRVLGFVDKSAEFPLLYVAWTGVKYLTNKKKEGIEKLDIENKLSEHINRPIFYLSFIFVCSP